MPKPASEGYFVTYGDLSLQRAGIKFYKVRFHLVTNAKLLTGACEQIHLRDELILVVSPGFYFSLQCQGDFVVQQKFNPSMMVRHIENVAVRNRRSALCFHS